VSEFDDIYKKLEENYDGYERERLDREDRRRAVGGSRKFKLPLSEKFLMPQTQRVWGHETKVSYSTANTQRLWSFTIPLQIKIQAL